MTNGVYSSIESCLELDKIALGFREGFVPCNLRLVEFESIFLVLAYLDTILHLAIDISILPYILFDIPQHSSYDPL